jgi:hypothetical protein
MSAAQRLARLCARMVPADRRDRCREEWLADLEHCSEVGVRTATVVFGLLSMTIQSQKVRFHMTDSANSLSIVKAMGIQIACMALVLGGVQGSYSWWSYTLWGIGLAGSVWIAVITAHAAVSTPAASRAPKLASAAITACLAVLVAAVVELNLHFEAVDAGSPNGPLVAVMVATGFAGVAAFLTLAGASVVALQRRSR